MTLTHQNGNSWTLVIMWTVFLFNSVYGWINWTLVIMWTVFLFKSVYGWINWTRLTRTQEVTL